MEIEVIKKVLTEL